MSGLKRKYVSKSYLNPYLDIPDTIDIIQQQEIEELQGSSGSGTVDSASVTFDNSGSAITSTNVESALKEVNLTALYETITIACSDETTDLEAATGVTEFQMPFGMTLTDVRATVTTAPAGSTLQVDVKKNGITILSTGISIDAGEKTSTTAVIAPVISDSSLVDSDVITIDIVQVGSSTAGTGLKVQLIGNRT